MQGQPTLALRSSRVVRRRPFSILVYEIAYFLRLEYDFSYMSSTARSEPDPLLHSLSQSLREARIHRGLSQQQLAEMAGVTRLRVIDIERGSASVAIGAYARVARSLGLQLALEAYRRPVFEELKETFR